MPSQPDPQTPPMTIAPKRPAVVLDTNVVLDWLVFRDASCTALAALLLSRQLAWHANEAMRAELQSVLPRPQLHAWSPDCEQILSTFDQLADLAAPPTRALQAAAPCCRDSADQKFIDLAFAVGARWLFSRDRALLDLAKRGRAHGVEVLTPVQWLRRYPTASIRSDDGAT